jgi:hypothetical protein
VIINSVFTRSAGNGIRFFCASDCLTTNYAAAAMTNMFTGFTGTPGLEGLTCPLP